MSRRRPTRKRGELLAWTAATVLVCAVGCSADTVLSHYIIGTVFNTVNNAVFTLLDFILPVVPPP